MIELIIGAILLSVNIPFIIYSIRTIRETKRSLSIDKIVSEIKEKGLIKEFSSVLLDQGVGIVNEWWTERGSEFFNGVQESLTNSLKMSLLGQKGGIASGESRNIQRLKQAIGQDMLHNQNPIIGKLLERFPLTSGLVESDPELALLIPQLIAQFTGKQPDDLIQGFLQGSSSSQDNSGGMF